MDRLGRFETDNLNKQGFGALDDKAKFRYALALRFTPGVCTVLALIGLILRSPIMVGAMALVTLSGALFPRGMVMDLVYNLGVRHLLRAPPLPPTPTPRRFSYLLSTVLLAGSALSLYVGQTVVGLVLGGMVVMGGAMLTATLWCLGSWWYRLIFPHAAAR